MRKWLALLAVAVVAMGCAPPPLHLYAGDRRPPEQLAKVALVGQSAAAWLTAVNGRWLDPFERDATGAYVMPGKNTFDAKYRTLSSYSSTVSLTVDVQAGHFYGLQFAKEYPNMPFGSVVFQLVDYGIGIPQECEALVAVIADRQAPKAAECLASHAGQAAGKRE